MKILITGGTGSLGKELLRNLVNRQDIERLVIFSRDELKQWKLSSLYPENKYPKLRFFLGDVRDRDRLKVALRGCDTVIHAAALKHVPAAEYNPTEFIKTNINGAYNLITECLENTSISKVISLSTDKASSPNNLYGATKLCSDKLMISAPNIAGKQNIKFAVVRYGNVFGSRGSVVPFFLNRLKENLPLLVTDKRMTRFSISLAEASKLVEYALDNSRGGEIFVPKLASYRILDLVNAFTNDNNYELIGIRAGEKIHEEMISSGDALSTVDIGNMYAIMKSIPEAKRLYSEEIKKYEQKFMDGEDQTYTSGKNERFLSINELKNLINKYKVKI